MTRLPIRPIRHKKSKSRNRNWDRFKSLENLENRILLAGDLVAGDANQDYYFNESDFVQVFQLGKFELGPPANWEEGDWNGAPGGMAGNPPEGDGEFNVSDLVVAFQQGQYKLGPYDADAGDPQHTRQPISFSSNAEVSFQYDSGTGSLRIESERNLTTIHLHSDSGLFIGDRRDNPTVFNGIFDVHDDKNLFKLELAGFGSLELRGTLPPGLSLQQLASDITVDGSFLSGGALVDLHSRSYVNPLGSGAAIAQTSNGQVSAENPSISIPFETFPGESYSTVFQAADELEASVSIVSAAGDTLASGSTTESKTIVFENIDTSSGGNFEFQIEALNQQFGEYSLQAYVNTTVEQETILGSTNNTMDLAQALDDSFRAVPLDMQTASVIGKLDLSDATPKIHFQEGFESGQIPDGWEFSSEEFGTAVVSNEFPAGEGEFALLMDANVPQEADELPLVVLIYDPTDGSIFVDFPEIGITTLEVKSESGIFNGEDPPAPYFTGIFDVDTDTKLFELDPVGLDEWDLPRVAMAGLTLEFLQEDLEIGGAPVGGGRFNYEIQLSNQGNATNQAIWTIESSHLGGGIHLSFLHAEWNDIETPIPPFHMGDSFGDGVSVSTDGESWHRVFIPQEQPAGEWQRKDINLSSVARQLGVSLDGELKIKFQHSGQQRIPNSGRGYDDIQITTISETDWFSMTPNAGELVSFVADSESIANSVTLSLHAADGSVIESGVTTRDVDGLINNFISDGTPVNVSVSGGEQDYSLFVIRNGQFDAEPNNAASESQPVSINGNLIGYAAGTDRHGFFYETAVPQILLVDSTGAIISGSVESAGLAAPREELLSLSIGNVVSRDRQYFLHIPDSVPSELQFITIPNNGARTSDGTSIIVDSLYSLRENGVAADALMIDGIPANAVSRINSSQLKFEFDEVPEGEHTATLAAESLLDITGRTNAQIQTTYFVDKTAPSVVSTSIATGETVPAGTVDLKIQFSEDIVTLVDPIGFPLIGEQTGAIQPTSTSFDADTSTLTLSYDADIEQRYDIEISSEFIEDLAGLKLDQNFQLHFATDISGRGVEGPLNGLSPLGSVVYSSETFEGVISEDDIDDFVISLDGGQVLTANVTGINGLQPAISLVSPLGETLVVSNPLSGTAFVSAAAVESGNYSIHVSGHGGTTGTFSMNVLLNAMFETRSANNSAESAQSLSKTRTAFDLAGVGQITVQGKLEEVGFDTITSDGFESRDLSDMWTTDSSDANARVRISDEFGAGEGDFALVMDGSAAGVAARKPSVLVIYDPVTGELAIDTHFTLTTIEIQSASGIFTGDPAQNLGHVFDVDTDFKIFKLGPDGYDDLSFGNVAQIGLTAEFLSNDLTIDGSGVGAGIPDFSLIVVEEGVRSEAIWTIDLATVNNPQLSFQHAQFNDSATPLPVSFVDSVQGDGVSISTDGQTWYRLFTPSFEQVEGWILETVDLSSVAQLAEIELDGQVQIKFQHYGNGLLPELGRGYDHIRINGEAIDQDWYSLELEDGQSVSLNIINPNRKELTVRLYDSNDELLTEAASDEIAQIQNYLDNTSDGNADKYSVQVLSDDGAVTSYQLVTTFNAGFHMDTTVAEPTVIGEGFYLVYNSESGQIDLFSDPEIAVVEITTTPAIPFLGNKSDFPHFFGSVFDVYNATKAFKLEPGGFGGGEGLVNFANVGPGWTTEQLVSEFRIEGSIVGGGTLRFIRGGVNIVSAFSPITTIESVFDLTVPRSYVGYLNADDIDTYRIELNNGSTLNIETSLPGGDENLFENRLDPVLELFGPNGQTLATSDDDAADGRNALLSFTATEDGIYEIALSGKETRGEYVISVNGDFAEPGFKALSTAPADGISTNQEITEFQVQFNRLLDLDSVQAEDLLINGKPTTSVRIDSPDTITFDVEDDLPQGAVELRIPAGSINDLGGLASEEVAVSFLYDTIAPTVVSISVEEDARLDAGPLTIDIQFSEIIDLSALTDESIVLATFNGTIVPLATTFNEETHVLTLEYENLEEGRYALAIRGEGLREGGIVDPAGNRMVADIIRSFVTLAGVEPYDGGFSPVVPLESFAFSSESIEKTFAFDTDEDTITFDVNANQLISISTSDRLGRHQATLVDPSGVAISSRNSSALGSSLVAVGRETGTYSLVLESVAGIAREYETRILLNQIFEHESVIGGNNNSAQSAQRLDRFFRDEIFTRDGVSENVTVLGNVSRGTDWYSVELEESERISIGISSENNTLSVSLWDEDLNLVHTGVPGSNFDFAINEALDQSVDGLPSTYFVLVESNNRTSLDYTLSVLKNAEFERMHDTQLGPDLRAVGSLAAGEEPDRFAFFAETGEQILGNLSIPFTQTDVPHTSLDLSIRLVDPDGQEIAAGGESFDQAAPVSGSYTVEIIAQAGSGGYSLEVQGEAVGPNRIQVVSATPENGQVLYGFPGGIVVEFTHVVDPSTIDTTDVLVSGNPIVSVEQLSPKTYAFVLGADIDAGDAAYSVQLVADSIANTAGITNDAFASSFTVDRSSADFDGDGDVDVSDLNSFCQSHSRYETTFDINQDGILNDRDYVQILRDVFGAAPGDINLDGRFGSNDLVQMFEIGKYETDTVETVWSDGDYNCDGRVSSSDLVIAFTDGGYEEPVGAVAGANQPADAQELPTADAGAAFGDFDVAKREQVQRKRGARIVEQKPLQRDLAFQQIDRLFERDVDDVLVDFDQSNERET